jgi:membrane protein insertase Oxa1/YidC/SpoIIIJ
MMPLGWGWFFPVIKYSAMVLVSIKTYFAIPWLSFFIICGLSVRLFMLPLMIRQMVLVQRMAKISPNIRLLSYCTYKCNLPFFKKYYYFMRSLFKFAKEVNVNLFTFAAYNIFQIPVFFIMVFSIRKISYEEDLTNTGILWFKNLNEPDGYFLLPFISAFLTYYNIGRGINKENEKWLINRWRSFFQVLQICYLPFTVLWPCVYFHN